MTGRPPAVDGAPPTKLLNPARSRQGGKNQIVDEAPAKRRRPRKPWRLRRHALWKPTRRSPPCGTRKRGSGCAGKSDAPSRPSRPPRHPSDRARQVGADRRAASSKRPPKSPRGPAPGDRKTQEASPPHARPGMPKRPRRGHRGRQAGERSTEPISVFVARRPAACTSASLTPIHEAPVTFKEPDLPSGRTCTSPRSRPRTARPCAGVRLAFPIADGHGDRARRGTAWRSGRGPAAAQPGRQRESAASVLERFELPPATKASSPTGCGRAPRSSSPTRASATRRGNIRLHRAEPLKAARFDRVVLVKRQR